MNTTTLWVTFAIIHIIAFVTYNQSYRIVAKKIRSDSVASFLLYTFAGLSILPLIVFFPLRFYPTTPLVFFPLLINMFVLYAFESNRTTMVRRQLDSSTVSILYQSTTIFLVIYEYLLFGHSITPLRILGILLIILANFFVLYERKFHWDRYTILTIACAWAYGTALAIDTAIGQQINYALYSAATFLVPAAFNAINGAITPKDIRKYVNNKKTLMLLIVASLGSAQLYFSGVLALQYALKVNAFSTAAAVMSSYNIFNAISEHFLFTLNKRFIKKLLAASIVVGGVYFALI